MGRHKGHCVSEIREAAENLSAFVCEGVEREIFSARNVRNELRSLQHCELGIETDLINLKEKIKGLAKQLREGIDQAERQALRLAEGQAQEALRECKKVIGEIERKDEQTNQTLELCQSHIEKAISDEVFLAASPMIRRLSKELCRPAEARSVETYSDVEPRLSALKSGGERGLDDINGLCLVLQNMLVLTQKKTWLFNA